VKSSAFFNPSSLNLDTSLAASSATTAPDAASTRRLAGGVSCVWYTSTKNRLSDEMPHGPGAITSSGRDPADGRQLPIT
jgi:hypothetical protein